MALIYIIRHGMTDMVPRGIAGRLPGISLNEEGRCQAQKLAQRLESAPLKAIYSSPLERAVETAAPLAAALGIEVQVRERLTELDCGEWTGRDFADMHAEMKWHPFNTFRTGTRIPGGELILEVQSRMVAEVEDLCLEHPEGTIAVVSHGDPIKTLLCYYAGIPLDDMLRITVSPASVSLLSINAYAPQLLCVNHTGELLPQ